MRATISTLLLLISLNSLAMWAQFAYISAETQDEFNIKIGIEKPKTAEGISVIKIAADFPDFKIVTLIETEKPLSIPAQKDLRHYLWRGENPSENIIFYTRLSPFGKSPIEGLVREMNSSEIKEPHYEVGIELCDRNIYLYIDSPVEIDDGGYWYSVDLNTYLDGNSC